MNWGWTSCEVLTIAAWVGLAGVFTVSLMLGWTFGELQRVRRRVAELERQ